MGYSTALDLAWMDNLDIGLSIHLQSNHYPPVPSIMVDPCKAAIAAYLEEDYDREIELPSPVLYRGSETAPARAIVEQHHLHAFVDTLGDRDDD